MSEPPRRSDCLDYSKWDHLDTEEDTSSDENGVGGDYGGVRVTRLDLPSTITLGGEPISAKAPSSSSASAPARRSRSIPQRSPGETKPCWTESSADPGHNHDGIATDADANTGDRQTGANGIPTSWTEKGAAVAPVKMSKDGTHPYEYYWSQDRMSVQLRFLVVKSSSLRTAFEVSVRNILPFADRYHAIMNTSQQPQRLVITQKPPSSCTSSCVDDTDTAKSTTTTTILLEGDLAHPVHSAEEEDTVDWSVEHHGDLCYILVTLFKATPMMGLTLWWKKMFLQQGAEIELSWVEPNSAFQQAWDQAHQNFRASIADPTKQPKYSV